MSGEQRVPASARHVDLLVSGDVLYTLNKGDPIVVVHQRLKFIPSMLLIRFGTRDRRRVVARGQFDCPKCEVERDYEAISLREWVTLFLSLFFQQVTMRKGKILLNAKPAKAYTILTC